MGWGNVGEWFEYTSNVSAAGPYSLSLRAANTAAGGTVHIEVDGINVTGSIAVPNTGGFQTWQTITKDGILLSAGQHAIKLVFDTAAEYRDWETDRKSTRLNSSHSAKSRMPSSA